MIFPGLMMHDDIKNKHIRELVRNKVRIVDFLNEMNMNPSRSYDGRHVYKCPIHAGDNSPSFYVYEPDDGHDNFFCFGCKKWGDIVDLKALIERIPIVDACALLCEKNGIIASSTFSESDLLDTEIDSWDKKTIKESDIDVGSVCFSMGRMFRNLSKTKKVSIDASSVLPVDIANIMRDFDKYIRIKDYNNALKMYDTMKKKFENA